MAVLVACDHCGRMTPIYRLAGVIFDGRVARLCPWSVAREQDRITMPYAPRTDNGAIQPSTSREAW